MDNVAKVWSLSDPRLVERVGAAAAYQPRDPKAFDGVSVHFPHSTVAGVHRNYVDCVRYLGDLVLSKSTDNRIQLWQPPRGPGPDADAGGGTGGVQELQDFRMIKCDIWYVRFCVDLRRRLVFCGNQEGKIYVWDADALVRENSTATSAADSQCARGLAHRLMGGAGVGLGGAGVGLGRARSGRARRPTVRTYAAAHYAPAMPVHCAAPGGEHRRPVREARRTASCPETSDLTRAHSMWHRATVGMARARAQSPGGRDRGRSRVVVAGTRGWRRACLERLQSCTACIKSFQRRAVDARTTWPFGQGRACRTRALIRAPPRRCFVPRWCVPRSTSVQR